MLIDNHHRVIDYLRLAVTDRCNLRCNYCMPAEGINFKKRDELLTLNELQQLTSHLVALGIKKIRITGGEPFVRKDLINLLRYMASLDGLEEISITTNATLLDPYIDELYDLGITKINVSLDAIEPEAFNRITRRNQYDVVYGNLMKLITKGFDVKINCIALDGQNTDQIIPMLALAKNYPVSVRFLEEMPFNGGSKAFQSIRWNHKKIYNHIAAHFKEIEKLPTPLTSTATNYHIAGFKGDFGIIPSFTRSFCGSCNRLRINANGDVITCLYGKAYNNIREVMRNPLTSEESLHTKIAAAVGNRAKNGFEAEAANNNLFKSSMTSIGG